MAKVKISIPRSEIVNVLGDRNPDTTMTTEGFGEVEGYLLETIEVRCLWKGPIDNHIAGLVREGFVASCPVSPSIFAVLFGARAKRYLFLTALGREAYRQPMRFLTEPLERDDYDRRYEPKGMWLRQAQGLPPLKD